MLRWAWEFFCAARMQAVRKANELPPEFIKVPSRTRPGEFSYWSQALGQKFATIDLAWIAYERMISSKRDPKVVVEQKIEPISPQRLAPIGTARVFSPRLQTGASSVPGGGTPMEPFTDPDFPPDSTSIGKTVYEDPASRLRITPLDRDKAEWIRLPDYIRKVNNLSDSDKVELFGNIEPNNLTQGIVGDCWLLATMACLAEFPNAVESLFCGQTKASSDGKYSIKLFNLDSRDWETVVIDDFIPCTYEDDYSNVPFRLRSDGVKVYDARFSPSKKLKPLFAIPNGNQMWAALLEKAMAKFVGTYALIAGGHEPFAMIAFTGFPQVYQYKRPPVNETKTLAKLGEWERGWAQWATKRSPCCGYRPVLPGSDETPTMKDDAFFSKLIEYDRMNYMMAASIVCYPPPSSAEGFVRPDGLVSGHAYSLLAVEEFGTVRLVKLRNPHGMGTPENPTEWRGRWSDDSEEWTKNEAIANCVGHERIHDGIFWMEYSDFVTTFDKVLVLPFPMSEPRGALSSMRRAKIRASMRTATANGKALANMALENLTHVDDVVTAIHLMSIKPYDPYLNAPDWVRRDQDTYYKWAREKLGDSPPPKKSS